jgi:hypothetical protein
MNTMDLNINELRIRCSSTDEASKVDQYSCNVTYEFSQTP